jgi:hypothetical protein
LSTSRSSSSASTRRSRRCSVATASDESATRAFAALGRPHLHLRAAALREELLERGEIAGVAGDDELRRDARRGAVVLDGEGLEHRRQVLAGHVLEVEAVAVDELAAPQREDLDGRVVALRADADHVDGADGATVGGLPLGEVLHRLQPVAVARRLLEALLAGGVTHPLLQLAQDRPRVAGEELDHAVDDRAVLLPRDVADAGRLAALDVVVEARDPAVAPGLRPLAGAELEDPVQHVERLAHLLRVRVRAEVPDPAPVALPREHDPRVLVLDRHRDVRERLVVAEPDVERRPVALDEVLLEVERLGLRPGDDHLQVGHAGRQLGDLSACIRRPLEVRADARTQRLRLPDVQHFPALVTEEVDARLRRQALELLFHTVGGHGPASVAA